MILCGVKHRFSTVRLLPRAQVDQPGLNYVMELICHHLELPCRWRCACLNRRLRKFYLTFKTRETLDTVLDFSSGHLNPDPFAHMLPEILPLKQFDVKLPAFRSWLAFGAWFISTALFIYRCREDPFALNPRCQPRNTICCDLHFQAVRLQFAGLRAFWRVLPPGNCNNSQSQLIGSPDSAARWSPEHVLETIVRHCATPRPTSIFQRLAQAQVAWPGLAENKSPTFLYSDHADLTIDMTPIVGTAADTTNLVAQATAFLELLQTTHGLRRVTSFWAAHDSTTYRLDCGSLAVFLHFPHAVN
eukprot:Protomagalhaensia_wolfi_Nauph_80__3067@NODE_313_length_2810_cov_196_444605_g236_i0_p1_GENE_NODE_313_length_2810_cov_196_444605_g236_i0NODE_313_length_2810_cov_196_444605_g236_i0_p1_ORF_typecomplete_len302_score17_82_NODE_313_length_2810_cov_196_444605_g236_i019032808